MRHSLTLLSMLACVSLPLGAQASIGGHSISSVLIHIPGGNFITDVRQNRVGTTANADDAGTNPQALVSAPEPGTLVMLATGLFALARHARRRLLP